jgi:hypothetical protein
MTSIGKEEGTSRCQGVSQATPLNPPRGPAQLGPLAPLGMALRSKAIGRVNRSPQQPSSSVVNMALLRTMVRQG